MNKTGLLFVAVLLLATLKIPSKAISQHGHVGGHGHWQAPAAEVRKKNPVPSDKASIERGGKIYKTYCASCHGERGKGDGPAAAGLTPQPPDLTHVADHHQDGELAWKIATGRGVMPGWKGVLSENQIWELVNFIKSLGK